MAPNTPQYRNLKITIGAAAFYSLLAGYYSYVIGSKVVFAFCMVPYFASLWVLIFTSPSSIRAGFSIGAIALLTFFGTKVITSGDPKAGALWWFHLFLVPLAAIGAGLIGRIFRKRLNTNAALPWAAVITITIGLLPFWYFTLVA